MSTSIKVEHEEAASLREMLQRVGRPVRGVTYQVLLEKSTDSEPGLWELLAINSTEDLETEVIGNPAVIAAVQGWLTQASRLFSGGGLFTTPETVVGGPLATTVGGQEYGAGLSSDKKEAGIGDIIPDDPDNTSGLRTRLINSLRRAGFDTTEDVLNILDQENGPKVLQRQVRNLGPESMKLLLRSLGSGEDSSG